MQQVVEGEGRCCAPEVGVNGRRGWGRIQRRHNQLSTRREVVNRACSSVAVKFVQQERCTAHAAGMEQRRRQLSLSFVKEKNMEALV